MVQFARNFDTDEIHLNVTLDIEKVTTLSKATTENWSSKQQYTLNVNFYEVFYDSFVGLYFCKCRIWEREALSLISRAKPTRNLQRHNLSPKWCILLPWNFILLRLFLIFQKRNENLNWARNVTHLFPKWEYWNL